MTLITEPVDVRQTEQVDAYLKETAEATALEFTFLRAVFEEVHAGVATQMDCHVSDIKDDPGWLKVVYTPHLVTMTVTYVPAEYKDDWELVVEEKPVSFVSKAKSEYTAQAVLRIGLW